MNLHIARLQLIIWNKISIVDNNLINKGLKQNELGKSNAILILLLIFCSFLFKTMSRIFDKLYLIGQRAAIGLAFPFKWMVYG